MQTPSSAGEKALKILVAPIAYNEEKKIISVFNRFSGLNVADRVVLMDDGSTDDTRRAIQTMGYTVISHPERRGVGAAIRTIIEYARQNKFDVLVIMAGNDKDRPVEIPRLTEAITRDWFDLAQGSRYLPGGDFGNMPPYRQIATKYIHPALFSLITGRRITDSTNGFRAIRLSVLEDPKIEYHQDWLDHYELEPYLFYKFIRLGYKVKEVPVTKIYPLKALGYTKMAPITGWWSILRPLILLGFGLKK